MPWQLEAMKGVADCDKPRGAVEQALIRGCPNGENPPHGRCGISGPIHKPERRTGGSEASQYPEEEKSKDTKLSLLHSRSAGEMALEIPSVAASERGRA